MHRTFLREEEPKAYKPIFGDNNPNSVAIELLENDSVGEGGGKHKGPENSQLRKGKGRENMRRRLEAKLCSLKGKICFDAYHLSFLLHCVKQYKTHERSGGGRQK